MHRTVFKMLLPLLALLVLFTSCTSKPLSTGLDYLQKDFTATLTGNREGTDFSCRVTAAEGRPLSLSYTAPEALKGIQLNRTEGGWRVEKDGISKVLPQASVEGLLLPAELLLPRSPTVQSVQKLSNGVQISLTAQNLPEPVTLTLSSNGAPTHIASNDISLSVQISA